ncbi:response regulator transcription factor [Salininema proteolyticum]|uniref:Response regulator transcription factor n=1 Tax=Salininema proteolyticum TaxID=1607685 RepID=A0ABV8U576_9ACTN
MTDSNTPPEALTRPDGSPAKLLVVDDEDSLAHLLVEALAFQGYDVSVAQSGSAALEAVEEHDPDLVVLDVNLPDYDGFSVAGRLREAGKDVPIIFLTARSGTDDLRDGYDAGGDDYLTKPFRLEELSLRVAAVLRRTLAVSAAGREGDTVTVADLTLDLATHTVTRDGNTVELSPTEFRLLRYLAGQADRVVTRPELLKHVWGYHFEVETNLAETYIFYLRRKLEKLGPRIIHTVRGVGYMLRTPKDAKE